MDSNAKQNIDNESNVRNVRELKMFFQNQKLPIIRFQQKTDNSLDANSSESSHKESKDNSESNDSKESGSECSTESRPVRPNRMIPRPPKPIQSYDIKVSSLIKVLPTNQTERPVPMPRKSLQMNSSSAKSDYSYKSIVNINTNSDNNVNNESLSDSNQRSNSLVLSTIKELKDLSLNGRTLKSHSIHSLPQNLLQISVNDQNMNSNNNNNCLQTSGQTVIDCKNEPISEKSMTTEKQSSGKSKKHFKAFLKRSKLLSLRKRTENNKKQKLKLCATNSDPSNLTPLNQKPVKPTRSPPLPPLLHFRPAAPLPPESYEDYYEDTLTASHSNTTGNSSNAQYPYELYNDSGHTEQIYYSLDNDESGTDYEGINDYDDGLPGDKNPYNTDNYYEESTDKMSNDCERIYEVLPFERDIQTDSDSNGSTVSLEEKKVDSGCDRLERKRELKAVKLKKKFNLTGEEIPVNAGIVKEDNKGSRYDLFVRKGETVLILRMEGNPPGKWLAKNERAKVGFVDLANISFDAESVKCIIKTLATHKH